MNWIVLAILSALSAAAVGIFGKLGVKGVDTTLATSVRSVIMAFFLVTAALLTGKLSLFSSLNAKAFAFIILSGISGAVSWLFYFFALSKGPASGVAALDRLSVVFVLIMSVMFLGERISLMSVLGAVLITAGAVLMVIR